MIIQFINQHQLLKQNQNISSQLSSVVKFPFKPPFLRKIITALLMMKKFKKYIPSTKTKENYAVPFSLSNTQAVVVKVRMSVINRDIKQQHTAVSLRARNAEYKKIIIRILPMKISQPLKIKTIAKIKQCIKSTTEVAYRRTSPALV